MEFEDKRYWRACVDVLVHDVSGGEGVLPDRIGTEIDEEPLHQVPEGFYNIAEEAKLPSYEPKDLVEEVRATGIEDNIAWAERKIRDRLLPTADRELVRICISEGTRPERDYKTGKIGGKINFRYR